MPQKPHIDIKLFQEFLETEVFHTKIVSLQQFQKGASSFNYVAQTDKKYIVKLAWKHQKDKVARLVDIINILSQKNLTPKLWNPDNPLFCYKNCFGFVSEYIAGQSPKAIQLNEDDFKLILEKYYIFSQTKLPDYIDLIPAYNFEEMLQNQLEKTDMLRQKASHHFILKYLLKLFKNELSEIQKTPLVIKQPTLIHGDFTHNNILKTSDSFFLIDFEDVGLGLVSEDLIRFLFAWRARLPVFYPYQHKQEAYLRQAQTLFHLTKEVWCIGLNSFILQKTGKLLRQKELSASYSDITKLIRVIYFLKKTRQIKDQLSTISF